MPRGDPNRLTWPPTRSDLWAVVCGGVATYCLIAGRWPGIVALALIVGAFTVLSPRMKGKWGLSGDVSPQGGSAKVEGRFESPFEEEDDFENTLEGDRDESRLPQAPAESADQRAPPRGTRPGAD